MTKVYRSPPSDTDDKKEDIIKKTNPVQPKKNKPPPSTEKPTKEEQRDDVIEEMSRLGLTMLQLVSPCSIATRAEVAKNSLFPPDDANALGDDQWVVDSRLVIVGEDAEGTKAVQAVDGDQINDKVFFNITVEGLPLTAQLDSGAAACAMSADVFKRIPNAQALPVHDRPVVLVDTNLREIRQTTPPRLMQFDIGGVVFSHPVYIVDNNQENSFLAGLCVMKAGEMSLINFRGKMSLLLGDPCKPSAVIPTFDRPAAIGQHLEDSLLLKEETVLQPLETRTVACCSDLDILPSTVVLPHSATLGSPLDVHSATTTPTPFGATIQLTNQSLDPLLLPEKTLLGSMTRPFDPGGNTAEATITINEGHEALPEDELEEILQGPPGLPLPQEAAAFDITGYLQKAFPPEYLDDFLRFLDTEVPGVISKSEYDFGCFDGPPMDIITTSSAPIVSKPYAFDEIRTQQLTKLLDHLVDKKIMRRGTSPWGSPAFLVPRKGEAGGATKLRLVLDYRQLNAKTLKDAFPLPLIEVLLNKLRGATFYTTLDLRSAFFSVKMTESASLKAAIRTPDAVYLPLRISMGLTSAPNYFCYSINEALRDHRSICSYYLDDIIVYTKGTKEQHLEDLKTVLRTLHRRGLKINVKAVYFARSIAFLGKVINRQGIAPLPKHLTALSDFPPPDSKKQLQRLLGLIAWVSAFLYNYAAKIRTLTEALTRPRFEWTEVEQEALDRIKEELSANVFLYFPDFSQPLYLASDICHNSYASILYQVTSYGPEDREQLNEAAKNVQEFPPPPVVTQHPVVPPPGKGVPPQFPLQGMGHENGQATHVVGAVGLQPRGDLTAIMKEEDRIHIVKTIGVHSGLFQDAQVNYGTLEKEVTGLVCALESFRHYLGAAVMTYVITDAQGLLWLLRFRRTGISKLERLVIRIFSFPFKMIITHMKGTANPADLLTRVVKVPEPQMTLQDAKRAVVVSTPFARNKIVTARMLLDALDNNPELVQLSPSKPTSTLNSTSTSTSTTTLNSTSTSTFNSTSTSTSTLATSINLVTEDTLQQSPAASQQDLSIVALQEVRVSSIMGELHRELNPASIIHEQAKDGWTQSLLSKVRENDGQFGNFKIQNGLLMHQRSPDHPLTIVVPDDLVPFVFAFFHLQNHAGANTLSRMIGSHYYIPRAKDRIARFTRACALCNRFSPNQLQKEMLGFAPLPTKKLSQIHMDLVVGLPPVGGKDAFLTLLDVYSGFKLAVPCAKTITAKGIATILRSHIIQTFGPPEVLVSDGGPNMLNAKDLQQFAKAYNIHTSVLVPYSAKSHGRVEAANKVISQLTKILSEQHRTDWTKVLSLAVHNLNCKPRVYFGGMSPQEIVFGTKTNPVDRFKEDESQLISEEEHKALFNELDKEVDRLIAEAARQMIQQNRAQGGIRTYIRPGSCVYLRDHSLVPKKKWKQKFISQPALVLRDYGTTLLVRSFLGLTSVVHKANCRPAPEREVESFARLPFRVKAIIGPPFSHEEVAEAVRNHQVPEFWKQKDPPYEPPNTRGRAAAEAQEEATTGEVDPLEESMNPFPFQDLDDEIITEPVRSGTPQDRAELGSRHVRFE